METIVLMLRVLTRDYCACNEKKNSQCNNQQARESRLYLELSGASLGTNELEAVVLHILAISLHHLHSNQGDAGDDYKNPDQNCNVSPVHHDLP